MEPDRTTPEHLIRIREELAEREPIFHHPELGTSREAARAFFSEQFIERVTNLYGIRPTVQYLRVAVLVDNAHSK